jgi:3-hydroxyisobutyrate dehydrogenase
MEYQSQSNVGWIGLGAMGLPMVELLTNRLPAETQIYVFDIVQDLIDKVVAVDGKRVHQCKSAKEVAERSVG